MNLYKEVIDKVKKVQLELLSEFDILCHTHNIKYQLFGGTLLGAVRHEGFIPWDDDIDVCMTRDNYEKFIEVCKTELKADYFLETPYTKGSPFPFAKLRKNGTEFIERSIKNKKMNHGIYIDIFPMDKLLINSLKDKVLRFRIKVLTYLRYKKLEVKGKNFFRTIFHFLVSRVIFFRSQHYYVKKIDKLAKKNNNSLSIYYTSLAAGFTGKDYDRFFYTAKDLMESKFHRFEGMGFLGPLNFDELLTKQYGDYMKEPELSDQKSNHVITKITVDGKSYHITDVGEAYEATLIEAVH